MGVSRSNAGETGSSLVGILMALAVVGILAAAFSQLMANTFAGLRRFETSSDMQDLRRVVRQIIDCPNSRAANASWASCNGTARQEAQDRSGKIVIRKTPPLTQMGALDASTGAAKYSLTLRCDDDGGSVVRLRLQVTLTKTGAVVSDDIFKTVPMTCPR